MFVVLPVFFLFAQPLRAPQVPGADFKEFKRKVNWLRPPPPPLTKAITTSKNVQSGRTPLGPTYSVSGIAHSFIIWWFSSELYVPFKGPFCQRYSF